MIWTLTCWNHWGWFAPSSVLPHKLTCYVWWERCRICLRMRYVRARSSFSWLRVGKHATWNRMVAKRDSKPKQNLVLPFVRYNGTHWVMLRFFEDYRGRRHITVIALTQSTIIGLKLSPRLVHPGQGLLPRRRLSIEIVVVSLSIDVPNRWHYSID